jgi:DNA-binding CsgD family transcriptional regulator
VVAAWPLTGRTEQLALLGSWYADAAAGGALVTGPPGVGKTRLAEEVLRLAGAAGRPCARAIGHPATQPIPLGALGHLLPADLVAGIGVGEEARATLFHAARAGLANRAAGQRLVLAVDDVDQLDQTSLALLLPLVVEGVVFLVATLRSGRETPAALVALLKDGHLERLELRPLDDDQIGVLIHRVLDGPLDAQGLSRLAELSRGNLQMLSELVHGALAREALVRDGSVWRLGELPTTAGLEELVAEHLAGIDHNGRRLLEVLAVAGRFGLADLEAWFDRSLLEDLEESGALHVMTSGRRTEVALAHPLYGEVLRAQLPVLRTRVLQRQLADRLAAHGIRRREDLVRVALWRLDGGGDVDTQLLLPAARLALAGRDTALAVRFAEAADAAGAPGEAALVLVEAYAMAGSSAAVESAVDAVWDDPDLTDAQRAHLSRKLADVRLTSKRDADGALDANARGLSRVTNPVERASLLAHRASMLATSARPLAALDAAAEVPVLTEARVRIELAAARSNALLALGRSSEAVQEARAGLAAQAELPAWLARRGLAQHLVNEAHALAYVGYYREAAALMEPAVERARQSGATGALIWFEIVLGEIERDRGRGLSCLRHFSTAASLAERAGQGATLVWALIGLVQGHLLRGEDDAAEDALRRADAVGYSPVGTSSATRQRAVAWLEASRGDLAAARQRLAPVADRMAEDGVLVFEAALRHDLVRFGDPAAASDRLQELAATVEGPLVRAMAAHALGATHHDADALRASLDQFEAMESLVLAAETAADLADVLRRDGDARRAAAVTQRMARLAERAEDARTQPLRRGTGVEPLTSREREVALLAARGMATKDIAARLVLSARTVDTHLTRVYRKLGVAGRAELAEALDDPLTAS